MKNASPAATATAADERQGAHSVMRLFQAGLDRS